MNLIHDALSPRLLVSPRKKSTMVFKIVDISQSHTIAQGLTLNKSHWRPFPLSKIFHIVKSPNIIQGEIMDVLISVRVENN